MPKDNSLVDIFNLLASDADLAVPFDKQRDNTLEAALGLCIFAPSVGRRCSDKKPKSSASERMRRARLWLSFLTDPIIYQAMMLLRRYPACQELSKSLVESRGTRLDPEVSSTFLASWHLTHRRQCVGTWMLQLNAMWYALTNGSPEKFTPQVVDYLTHDLKRKPTLLDTVDRLLAEESPMKDIGTREEVLSRLRNVDFADPETPSYAKWWRDQDVKGSFGFVPHFNGLLLVCSSRNLLERF